MTIFTLPDLGEGLREAEIVSWHVSEGDHVVVDQPLVSVETDKAVMEIPTPYSGTVARLIPSEGDIVRTGTPLAEIETGKPEDEGTIVGTLSGEAGRAVKPVAAPATPYTGKAAPAVRRLAREKGVDLAVLTGSGPGGAILTRDIEAVAPGVANEELRGVRRAMAEAMAQSHASVVPATVTDRADISDWSENENPTRRLVQAIGAACAEEPALNAWFDGQRRKLHKTIDLAVAVDTPDGLFTPVLRDIGAMTDIAEKIAELRCAVQDRSIQHEAMRNATFTLSNFGMLGGEFAALVVIPPQVAILGAGRIFDMCLTLQGQPAIRRVLPLSLTFDHRAVTGGEAARFLAAVKADLKRER